MKHEKSRGSSRQPGASSRSQFPSTSSTSPVTVTPWGGYVVNAAIVYGPGSALLPRKGQGPVQAGQIKAFRCALDLRKEHFPPLTQGGMAAQIGVGKVKPVHPQGLKPGCVRQIFRQQRQKGGQGAFPGPGRSGQQHHDAATGLTLFLGKAFHQRKQNMFHAGIFKLRVYRKAVDFQGILHIPSPESL